MALETTTGPTLAEALAALRVEAETQEGYDRDLFKHWIDEDKDVCSTRQEVLIAEASLLCLSLNTYRRSRIGPTQGQISSDPNSKSGK